MITATRTIASQDNHKPKEDTKAKIPERETTQSQLPPHLTKMATQDRGRVYSDDQKQFIHNPQLNVKVIRHYTRINRPKTMKMHRGKMQVQNSPYLELENIIDLGPEPVQEESDDFKSDSSLWWEDPTITTTSDSLNSSNLEATYFRDTLTPNQKCTLFNDAIQMEKAPKYKDTTIKTKGVDADPFSSFYLLRPYNRSHF